MSKSDTKVLTRQELYDLVWSTPMRLLAPRYGLSDVGLAKVCKKHNIPRPPVGYWAKIAHGKSVSQPKLPTAPTQSSCEITIETRPPAESNSTEHRFFDAQLAEIAGHITAGELVASVKSDLRGCHPLARQSRNAIKAANRKPTYDRWGGIERSEPYSEPHVYIDTSKEQQQRALLLVDAVAKTMDMMGVEQKEPTGRPPHTAVFALRGWEFEVRVREKTKRIDHTLTEKEQQGKKRYRYSFAPRYDYTHTGQLIVELRSAGSGYSQLQLKDAKRAGLVEEQLTRLALAIVQEADEQLERESQRAEARRREVDRIKQECIAAERRQLEEEKRQAELVRQKRLFQIAEDQRQAALLKSFLQEVEQRIHVEGLGDQDLRWLDRWLCWAKTVAQERDPFSNPLINLPELTHPRVRESEGEAL